jgi:hypothetical protein
VNFSGEKDDYISVLGKELRAVYPDIALPLNDVQYLKTGVAVFLVIIIALIVVILDGKTL